MKKNIVVIGSSGAIGSALLRCLNQHFKEAQFYAFSSTGPGETLPNVSYHEIKYSDEESIAHAAKIASEKDPIDMIIITVGILHTNEMSPEKSLNDLSSKQFHYFFETNTILPALIIKQFSSKLRKDTTSIIAALSARVGSISDNKLGGWYSYRASKAALNMVIKNCAIEVSKKRKQSIIVSLHPGTVDSNLSKPFQKNIPKKQLFSPQRSADEMTRLLLHLSVEDTGKCFAWDGSEIKP